MVRGAAVAVAAGLGSRPPRFWMTLGSTGRLGSGTEGVGGGAVTTGVGVGAGAVGTGVDGGVVGVGGVGLATGPVGVGLGGVVGVGLGFTGRAVIAAGSTESTRLSAICAQAVEQLVSADPQPVRRVTLRRRA